MSGILENIKLASKNFGIDLDSYYFFGHSQASEIISCFSEDEIELTSKNKKILNNIFITSKKIPSPNRYTLRYSIETLFGKEFILSISSLGEGIKIGVARNKCVGSDIAFVRALKEWYSLFLLRKMILNNKCNKDSHEEGNALSIILEFESLQIRKKYSLIALKR